MLNLVVDDTKLSEYRLVNALLGHITTFKPETKVPCIDPFSIWAVGFLQADYGAKNRLLSNVDWKSLNDFLQNNPCGKQFLEFIRLTVL